MLRTLFALVVVLAACSVSEAADTTVTTSPVTTSPIEVRLPRALVGWETATISIDDRQLLVAVADEPDKHRLGLMFVEDLGDLDGMFFTFDGSRRGGFWMRNTYIPLDIAFFDWQGEFVDRLTMEPCIIEACPTYHPDDVYRYAVEVPAGDFADLTENSKLSLE